MVKNGPKGPVIPNVGWMPGAGIDPKTGFPEKVMLNDSTFLKNAIKKQLRNIDKLDTINSGTWYNIPCDISSQDLERMIYYKYKLCLFYNKPLGRFFILPFTLNPLDGIGIDELGRYTYIKPVAYVGGATEDEDGDGEKKKKPERKKTPIEEYLSQLSLKVRYAPVSPNEIAKMTEEQRDELLYNSAVILKDYSPSMNVNDAIPTSVLIDPLLDVMAECIPYCRTSMIASCGIKGIRVGDADEAHNVYAANLGIKMGAMSGEAYVPIEGKMEFQELTDNAVGKVQDYFLTLQSLDNYRLQLHGIQNGGLFEKKAHELNAEASINGGPVALVQQDRTSMRQDFCCIVNSIWPNIGMWYEPSENLTMADTNGDGVLYDRNETGENSGIDTGGSDNEENV